DDDAVGVVHVAGGLVGEEQRRVVEHRAAERDALLLAARQLLWVMLRPAEHAELLEQCERPPPGLREVASGVARREQDVLERGERREQQERLEDEADPPAARAALRRARQRADADFLVRDLARLGVFEKPQHREQCALAGARGPSDHHELAALHREVDAREDPDGLARWGPVRLHEASRPQHGATRLAGWPRPARGGRRGRWPTPAPPRPPELRSGAPPRR